MQGRQSLVAGRHAAPTRLLQVLKEQPHVLWRDVIDTELIDRLADLARDKWDQQNQRVAVTLLRVTRQIAFAHQVLQQKTPHPGSELRLVSHGAPPEKHIVQSAPTLAGATPGSSSDRPGWRRCGHARDKSITAAAVFARRRLVGTRTSVGGRRNYAADHGAVADNARRRCGGPRYTHAVVGSSVGRSGLIHRYPGARQRMAPSG